MTERELELLFLDAIREMRDRGTIVMQKHPEDIPLLKLSQYAESVEIVEAAEKKE